MSFLVLKPIRDTSTPHAPYAVRVLVNHTGDEVAFYGWHATLPEAFEDAIWDYPEAEVLEPEWALDADAWAALKRIGVL